MKKLNLLIIILITNTSFLLGQSVKQDHSKQKALLGKYEVIDIVFQHSRNIDKPFEVKFYARFTNPKGKEIIIPGFYDGENNWVLRFSGNVSGEWKFITSSSEPKLDKLKGEIEISNITSGKHGSVVINKNNPHKFEYEDGAPYILQACEIDWLFALDYDNNLAAPKSEHLLELLANNGINQIVTTLYSYDVKWEKDEKLRQHPEHEYGGRDDIYPFLGSNKNPDFSSLNVTFFQRFDRLVELMHQNNQVAHLMIYVWNKKVKWPKPGSLEDNRFFDYVVKRYSAFPNVIWNVSKEAFRHKEAYMLSRIDKIREIDAFDRLVTIHDLKTPSPVDFISLQEWSSTLYSDMLKEYEKYNKPVINIENGGYAHSTFTVFPGDYTKPETCLRRNYLCYFAGVYANYYWQDIAWNVMVHNPFELPDNFVKPKLEYYKHLEAFFTKIGYENFYPLAKENKSGYCLKNDEGVYLYYIPKENYQLSPYGNIGIAAQQGTYQWFNTLSGEYTSESEYTGGMFRHPFYGEADAILIRKTQINAN